MQALLCEGDTAATYLPGARLAKKPSLKKARANHGHAVTSALAAACARAAWDRLDYIDALLTYGQHKGGQHARQMRDRKGHDKAVSYLDRVWEQAKKLVGVSGICSRQDAVADLIALRDTIASCSWKGTAQSTALRLLMAHLQAARKAGGRLHTLSYREAAEIAGCTVHTAYKATTKRLGRWLRKVDSGSDAEGSTWILMDGTKPSHEVHTPQAPQAGGAPSNVPPVRNGELDGEIVERLMGLDAFAHRGLGSSSLKLLAALAYRDGQSVAELQESASVSQATAYRHLKRLGPELGLVAKSGEVWQLTETAREALGGAWSGWHQVAAEVGTYGTSWRRQQLHQAQREVWRGQILPRLRERRMPDVVPVRGDEPPPGCRWGSAAFNPRTGEIVDGLVVASDGRYMVVPEEEPDYQEMCRRAREAENAYLAA